MNQELERIEQTLDAGSYRVGDWQRLMREADALSASERSSIADDVSRVSRKLHARNGFPALPFVPVYGLEWLLLFTSVALIRSDSLIFDLIGCVLLALTLQPLMKISTGLLMGLRYDYAYLWYFEPRFKMRYGTYFCLPGTQRVGLHLIGSLGTPIALWIAYLQLFGHMEWLGWLALIGAVGAGLMQVAAFVAEWLGVRRVAGFRLSQLTSPATAAFELKAWRARDRA